MEQRIKIGIDFDGVLAYNPFRIIRAPITYTKRKIFKAKRLHFYVPKTPIERFVWTLVHESSFLPARGLSLLKDMSKEQKYEFHIVTARFHFLQPGIMRWIIRNNLEGMFTDIHMNKHDKQPHIHKLDKINELQLDYFIEDNWDIVEYLNGKVSTKVLWIYNITDKNILYTDKFPYLEKALRVVNSK
jgi:hypothetical protein